MFGLFKRKKRNRAIQDWEMALLKNAIRKLPEEFRPLEKQLEKKLLTSASASVFYPDYIDFSFNPELINDFEDKGAKDYELTNIRVLDSQSKKTLIYTISVFSGVISGYSLRGCDQPNVDVNSVDVGSYVKRLYGSEDYDKLSRILNAMEISLVNPGDVYEVPLKGTVYYHIKDLDDGDFIGIDQNKVVYKITHDPFEIAPLNETLEQIFKD